MPVRSTNSPVLVWPKKSEVRAALEAWAGEVRRQRPEVVRIGVFGSLLRDDWGVGSDADVVIIVRSSDRPMMERPVEFDFRAIPVGVDLLVYTLDEWEAVAARDNRFGREMARVDWL